MKANAALKENLGSVVKLPLKIDADRLLQEFRTLSPPTWSETFPTLQQALQAKPNDPNPLLTSCGSFDVTMGERPFNVIVDHLKGTYTEQVLSEIPYPVCRTRYMRLMHKSCYSIHADICWRFHIPLETNPNCVLLFFDKPEHYRLDVGSVYMVNTTRPHTYMNGGVDERLHIVGSVPDYVF